MSESGFPSECRGDIQGEDTQKSGVDECQERGECMGVEVLGGRCGGREKNAQGRESGGIGGPHRKQKANLAHYLTI